MRNFGLCCGNGKMKLLQDKSYVGTSESLSLNAADTSSVLFTINRRFIFIYLENTVDQHDSSRRGYNESHTYLSQTLGDWLFLRVHDVVSGRDSAVTSVAHTRDSEHQKKWKAGPRRYPLGCDCTAGGERGREYNNSKHNFI